MPGFHPLPAVQPLFLYHRLPTLPGSSLSIALHAVISSTAKKHPFFTIYPSLALAPLFWFLIVTFLKAIAYIVAFSFPTVHHTDTAAGEVRNWLPCCPVQSQTSSLLMPWQQWTVTHSFPPSNGFILSPWTSTHWLLLLISSWGLSESLPGCSFHRSCQKFRT